VRFDGNGGLPTKLFLENVSQSALQTLHNLLETSQCDALLALLQPVQSGSWQAKFFGKFGEGCLAAFFTEKRSKLFFENIAHIKML
jgi:hypothetical protein